MMGLFQRADQNWLHTSNTPSLSEVFATIAVDSSSNKRKFFSFVGPGYLVAVGYMDPGNWATSLAGGAQFGYALLFVALLSNVMAIILQSLCARLAIASKRDLAQACHDSSSKWMSRFLWIGAEIAIIATDLAEIIGTAIGLMLLFKIPLTYGIFITFLNTFLILWLQTRGFRKVEIFIAALIFVIFVCFAVQVVMVKPSLAGIASGFIPTTELLTNPAMLYLAMGILGATVMPHNLYLHSAIVQTRKIGESDAEKRDALKYATLDSTIALMFALLINASILILAAAAFHYTGNKEVADINRAHELLAPILGSDLAPKLFAIALICCGLNSTVTATLAGQVVMEGFIKLRFSLVTRQLITRLFAIIPAIFVIFYYGESQMGKLLILSQVVLSLQLPFAIVPLVIFTSQKAKMGSLVAPKWLTITAWLIAAIIITLNIKLLYDLFFS